PGRTTNRDIEITRVELRDSDGTTTQTAEHGRAIQVVIRYKAHRDLHDIAFGYGIHAENGAHVCGTHTQIAGLPRVDIQKGSGEAVFEIDELPLIAGNYEVSAAIADKHIQHIFDRRDRDTRLLVRRGSIRSGVGLVEIPGSWRIRPDESTT
ncbi:MAG TPA: hypothetical protein DEG43_17330, partial [Acidimicrobiaceae bacterium]|nr:hypothetical protein [Acidimicrobiaceae bacterium]